ncbi:MAG: L,D-transpeptidase [Proteobacteria bacterium]|nr:L,D-transpeptidase [Pseudomonadota bacterium]
MRTRREAFTIGMGGLGVAVAGGAPAGAVTAQHVNLPIAIEPGAILVSTSQRMLYFAQGDGTAIRYRVAVGKPGKQWFGTRIIDGKHIRPAWAPPEEVKRAQPYLPDYIEGGAPNNPMGAAALTITPGEYAIHGTSASMRASIGSYASYGCIRMLDEDVLDLLPRVRVGARIHVVR